MQGTCKLVVEKIIMVKRVKRGCEITEVIKWWFTWV